MITADEQRHIDRVWAEAAGNARRTATLGPVQSTDRRWYLPPPSPIDLRGCVVRDGSGKRVGEATGTITTGDES